MATYNKFNAFAQYLASGTFKLYGTPAGGADALKVMLTNTLPVATNSLFSDLVEIAAGNGYTAGGAALVNQAGTIVGGTVTLASDEVVWTCATAAMAPFEYVVLYDPVPTTPLHPLIGWWDYGSALTLNPGDTFTVEFSSLTSGGAVFTVA